MASSRFVGRHRCEMSGCDTRTRHRYCLAHRTGPLDAADTAWMVDAACRQHPEPGWWHADTYMGQMMAVDVCRSCPVIRPCQEYVMATEPSTARHGVWGGLLPQQRKRLSS